MDYTKHGRRMKAFEKLDIMDDFLMNAVASDPEVGEEFCRVLLSGLLQREVKKIRPLAQRVLLPRTPDRRGVRLDVEVEEYGDALPDSSGLQTMNVYDLEPHRKERKGLIRRNRFYQARIDSRKMKRGERDFDALPNLYVINILDFDPFGYDYMLYTVENHCREVEEMEYDDGLQFLYFNTKGTKGGSEEIRKLLGFLEESREENVTGEATRKLYEYISLVKQDPEVRDGYMTLDEIIDDAVQEAIKEARPEIAEETIIHNTQDNILDLLEDFGAVPKEVAARICGEKRLEMLKVWHKLAARTNSIEEFWQKM